MRPYERPLRVCMVVPLPPPHGGIARWATMTIEHARCQAGVDVDVLDIAPRYRETHDLTRWRRVVFGGLSMLRQTAILAARLLRHRDLVHIATAGQLALYRDILMLWVCRLFRTPAVLHIHFGRVPEIAAAGTREWRLMKRAAELATLVIPLDAQTKDALLRCTRQRHVVQLPNAVDPSRLPVRVSGTENRTVVYLGWAIPKKGIEELIAAWRQLKPEGWELRVVGPFEARYRETLLSGAVDCCVNALGEKPHAEAMRELVQAAILVLPSHTEAFPNVILEAMAVGVPVVATRVGAIPEMLADDSGILVEPEDVESLMAGLKRAMDDAALRNELVQKAHRRVCEYYSLDAVCSKLYQTWQSVAGVTP